MAAGKVRKLREDRTFTIQLMGSARSIVTSLAVSSLLSERKSRRAERNWQKMFEKLIFSRIRPQFLLAKFRKFF